MSRKQQQQFHQQQQLQLQLQLQSRHYRQGDILLLQIPAIPSDAQKQSRPPGVSIVLGEGETTGHRHEILDPGAEAYRRAEGFYLDVTEEDVGLVHPEHDRFAPLPGPYEVIRQYEFARKEFRQVQD
jgi:hypothetical protein